MNTEFRMRGGAGGAGGGLGYDGVGSGATYRTNRGLLFGSREGGGSTGGGASGNPNVSAARDAEAVERDNQMQVDSLTGKVGMMKDVRSKTGWSWNVEFRRRLTGGGLCGTMAAWARSWPYKSETR
mmetsp:Transcript_13354/g.27131  ORF Transcript_13354/g.27131 Transcript_13354/m.27131 type:complete len:126 (-) Transcript_13354:897-1274(-)